MNYQKFPFGKYKGVLLEEIPTSYLVYAIKEFDLPTELKNTVKQILAKDLGLTISVTNPFEAMGISAQEVNLVYKKLAKKYHPDMGGSNDSMLSINEFKEQLLLLL